MPEKVTLNRKLGIIEIRSYETVDFKHMAESIETVRRLYGETGIDKVLVDTRDLTALPGTIDMFELMKSFPRYLKIAVLVLSGSEFLEQLQFGANVAFNRGVSIRIFDSETDAIDWLLIELKA